MTEIPRNFHSNTASKINKTKLSLTPTKLLSWELLFLPNALLVILMVIIHLSSKVLYARISSAVRCTQAIREGLGPINLETRSWAGREISICTILEKEIECNSMEDRCRKGLKKGATIIMMTRVFSGKTTEIILKQWSFKIGEFSKEDHQTQTRKTRKNWWSAKTQTPFTLIHNKKPTLESIAIAMQSRKLPIIQLPRETIN